MPPAQILPFPFVMVNLSVPRYLWSLVVETGSSSSIDFGFSRSIDMLDGIWVVNGLLVCWVSLWPRKYIVRTCPPCRWIFSLSWTGYVEREQHSLYMDSVREQWAWSNLGSVIQLISYAPNFTASLYSPLFPMSWGTQCVCMPCSVYWLSDAYRTILCWNVKDYTENKMVSSDCFVFHVSCCDSR